MDVVVLGYDSVVEKSSYLDVTGASAFGRDKYPHLLGVPNST